MPYSKKETEKFMRAVVQRVSRASVSIAGRPFSSIGKGLLVLLGITNGDTGEEAKYTAEKCNSLRIFDDGQGKMNLSVREVEGSIMVVSQFTLYGDARKGNRPSFIEAAPPDVAEPLYNTFVQHLCTLLGNERVATGLFRTMMDVELVNDGPVTLIVESKR